MLFLLSHLPFLLKPTHLAFVLTTHMKMTMFRSPTCPDVAETFLALSYWPQRLAMSVPEALYFLGCLALLPGPSPFLLL